MTTKRQRRTYTDKLKQQLAQLYLNVKRKCSQARGISNVRHPTNL